MIEHYSWHDRFSDSWYFLKKARILRWKKALKNAARSLITNKAVVYRI